MKKKILIIGNLGYIGTMLSDHIKLKYKKNYVIGYDSGIFKKCYFGKKIRKKTIDLQVFGDVRKFDYNILKDIEHVIYLAAVSNDPMGNKFIKPTLFISGEFDNVAPNNIHTDIFYNNTPESTDKLLYEISGGFHSTVTSPYNDQEMGLKTLFWIEKYILNNFSNCESLVTQPPTASTFLTNLDCTIESIGDITQDGITNVLDLVLLISWIINGVDPSDQEMDIANIINDSALDIFDIIMLADVISTSI